MSHLRLIKGGQRDLNPYRSALAPAVPEKKKVSLVTPLVGAALGGVAGFAVAGPVAAAVGAVSGALVAELFRP